MPTVLVVDDDKMIRDTIRRILEPAGFTLIEAPNGREGLRLFAERHPTLVITDLLMPEKEGLETIREIRAHHTGVRILAISGGGRTRMTGLLGVAEQIGADATLAKPFRAAALLQAVRDLLEPVSSARQRG